MIRFLFRLAGQVVLALGLVFAVADIARSLANDNLSLTTLGDAARAMRLPLQPPSGASERMVDLVALVSLWLAAVALVLPAFLLMFIGRRPAGPAKRQRRR